MSDVNIPFDIQIEIIKRVFDVKSLLRFRSVSKPWKSFIDTPKFINGYGDRDTQPHRLLLRYKEAGDPVKVKYVSFVDDVTFPQQQQQLDFAPDFSGLNDVKVIGSSCGLWCFKSSIDLETDIVIIWNPAIRKSIRIIIKTRGVLMRYGFGVCPLTYDPTIVGISYMHVQIFTLSSKTWKMIPTNMFRGSFRLRPTTQVAIGRFIFWDAYDEFPRKNLILSFDLITHEFKKLHLPVNIPKVEWPLDISISELNGSLVVFANTDEVNDYGQVHVAWIMGEEGVVFEKLWTINILDRSTSKLLGFRKSGQCIMETRKEGEMVAALEVYESCSQIINNLGFCGVKNSLFICPYKETLLLADHSDGQSISVECPINEGWLYC